MNEDKKRITLALDAAAYKRLKLFGVETGRTNQDIIECALREYMARQDA